MSILPLLVFVGVACADVRVTHSNDAARRPIITPPHERRICAELCSAGLGGEPCGKSCQDISPSGMPFQSAKSSKDSNKARRESCSVLCPNHLGFPLCTCAPSTYSSTFKPDFVKICAFFCATYNYKIDGCQECAKYAEVKNAFDDEPDGRGDKTNPKEIDWVKWCIQQCSNGTGGPACNCDITPFANRVS